MVYCTRRYWRAHTGPRLTTTERENDEERERESERNEQGARTQEGRKGMWKGREPTRGGWPDKYYCNYTLRFISCERALIGVDGIIYHGTLIKIIIRALNRGEDGMGIMFTFPCGQALVAAARRANCRGACVQVDVIYARVVERSHL